MTADQSLVAFRSTRRARVVFGTDQVMRKAVPVPWTCPPQGGRPPKHGSEFVFGRPETWGDPDAVTITDTDRYGTATATARARDRLRPRLTRRAA